MARRVGFHDKVYPVNVPAAITEVLAREGVEPAEALAGVPITARALYSAKARVSLSQVLKVCRNAAELSSDPHFAFQAGQNFHLSTYGLYGFAILSSKTFRQAIDFALRYHVLSTPLIELSFHEECGRAAWHFVPIAHPSLDAKLLQFVVELNIGIIVSLHRDLMGPEFSPAEVHLPFGQQHGSAVYQRLFGCPVVFLQTETRVAFDAAWLDRRSPLANEITYREVVRLCDDLMDQLQLRTGLAGRVRGLLLKDQLKWKNAASVAQELGMTERTLRRRLSNEQTSFRRLVHELRMHLATKYLRDTDLNIQEISEALGFSDNTAFRHAFRRWTQCAPLQFRARLKNATERTRAQKNRPAPHLR